MRMGLLAAALAGASGVIIGAWMAHGAGRVLGPGAVDLVETGLKWQMWHAVALLALAAFAGPRPPRLLAAAAAAFAIGIVLFSGSLYVFALTRETVFRTTTPLGGVAFIIGWVLLAAAAFARR